MSYGTLTRAQKEALRPWVLGQHIHDLGAGNCGLAQKLLRLGALHVTAVDSTYPPAAKKLSLAYLDLVTSRFSDYVKRVDVAFISWPINNSSSDHLIKIIENTPVVIYLGCNTGGFVCGSPELFRHFSKRIIHTHCPDPVNSLTVYGACLPKIDRHLTSEEVGALDPSCIWTYEMAQEAVRLGVRLSELKKISALLRYALKPVIINESQ